jgi:hypothetical protein
MAKQCTIYNNSVTVERIANYWCASAGPVFQSAKKMHIAIGPKNPSAVNVSYVNKTYIYIDVLIAFGMAFIN